MTKVRKLNSINGRRKSHSFLREAGLFVASLEGIGLVHESATRRFEPYHGPPRPERIEVVGVDCRSARNYLQIKYFSGECSQKITLYAPYKNFLDIMNQIIVHCSRR